MWHWRCVEGTLWILLGIQIKGLYYGCISPGSTFHAGNGMPASFVFFFLLFVSICVFILVVQLGLHNALALLIATSHKVMKILPELLKAFVMKWP